MAGNYSILVGTTEFTWERTDRTEELQKAAGL
jgi:hypothetical protein